jgi:hypothetical protein
VLLPAIPEDGFAGSDGLTRTVAAGHPPPSADDDEELARGGRVSPDGPARPELDHGHVGLRSEPPDTRRHALETVDLALPGELDAPQSRSITPAIAWPNPMHMQAIP